HHIKVKPLGFTVVDHFNIALKICKVCCKDGGGYDNVTHFLKCLCKGNYKFMSLYVYEFMSLYVYKLFLLTAYCLLLTTDNKKTYGNQPELIRQSPDALYCVTGSES